MTYDDFKRLVRQMREAQRNYFRDRSPQWLQKSKDFERAVDRALGDGGQKQLFPGTEAK